MPVLVAMTQQLSEIMSPGQPVQSYGNQRRHRSRLDRDQCSFCLEKGTGRMTVNYAMPPRCHRQVHQLRLPILSIKFKAKSGEYRAIFLMFILRLI